MSQNFQNWLEVAPEMATSKERTGMIELSWNKHDSVEVASAQKTFTEYARKGWLAFEVMSDNRKKQVFSFNPEAEKVYLTRVVEGG